MERGTLEVAGVERGYWLARAQAARGPLLIMLHGSGTSGGPPPPGRDRDPAGHGERHRGLNSFAAGCITWRPGALRARKGLPP